MEVFLTFLSLIYIPFRKHVSFGNFIISPSRSRLNLIPDISGYKISPKDKTIGQNFVILPIKGKKLKTKSFLEFINASACIDKFLLAGEERMAFTANVDFDYVNVLGSSRFELFSASALDGDNFIFRMNIRFHIFHLTELNAILL